jgi:hypothetical protein
MIIAMRFPRRVMPEDEFWQFIAILDGSTDDDAVERLTAALRAAGKRKAVAFAERLAATLYELDREVLCDQPVRWFDDPEGVPPIPLSGDSFLYLRAAVVVQGKAVVDQVIADPTVLLTRPWDDGEALLYAAEHAAGGEIETKLSYETGSNEEHWSPDDFDPETHETPVVAVLLSDLSHPIEAYEDDAMTIPVEPVMYAWPRWFPFEVLGAVNDEVNALVRDGGGVPERLGEQIQIYAGFGEVWQPAPQITWDATDDTGLGRVVEVRVQLRQAEVRAWQEPQQQAALRSLAAVCCLAVLPADHGSRGALEQAAAEWAPPG